MGVFVYFCVDLWVFLCLCVSEEKGDEERSQFVLHKELRRKKSVKINKIMVYTSYSKMCKINNRRTYAEDFWSKICKICCFLYFINVYITDVNSLRPLRTVKCNFSGEV